MLDTPYLHISVGIFELAVETRSVLRVESEVDVSEELGVTVGGVLVTHLGTDDSPTPLFHIGEEMGGIFGGRRWERVPFVVTLDSPGGPVALCADRISYVRQSLGRALSVPRWGLDEPEMLLGAVRNEESLLVVLDPSGLRDRWQTAQDEAEGR